MTAQDHLRGEFSPDLATAGLPVPPAAPSVRTRLPTAVKVLSGLSSVVGYLCILAGVEGLLLHSLTYRISHLLVAVALSPLLMFLTPLAVVIFGARRRWLPLGVAVLVMAGCAGVLAPRYVGRSVIYEAAGGDAPGPGLTVLTANIHGRAGDADSVVRVVRENHVDVVMLEELNQDERERLHTAGLDDVLPHNTVDAAPGTQPVRVDAVGIWTRDPLTDIHRYDDFDRGTTSATVSLGSTHTPVTLLVTHLSHPWPEHPATWLGEMTRLRGVLTDLGRFPGGHGVIVAGDFNATYDMTQFRDLLGNGYADAAEEAGAGMVPTYPANAVYPPVIGIDHVLTRQATATSVRSVTVPGAEHRGLLTKVGLAAA